MDRLSGWRSDAKPPRPVDKVTVYTQTEAMPYSGSSVGTVEVEIDSLPNVTTKRDYRSAFYYLEAELMRIGYLRPAILQLLEGE